MFTPFNRLAKTVLLVLLMPGYIVSGQLTVTTTFLPPPVRYLEEMPYHVNVTVVNSMIDYMGDFSLKLTLEGDNGIRLQTRYHVYPQMHNFSGSGAIVITGAELEPYFRAENLDVTGITQDELFGLGLPDGNYRICFQVLYDGVLYSGELPAGCSSWFELASGATATLAVLPPYPFRLEDYANQLKITLTSKFTEDFRLAFSIRGDNGIELTQLQNYNADNLINFPGGIPTLIPEMDLADYFRVSAFNIRNISSYDLQTNGLPAGRYRICLDVLDKLGESVLLDEVCSPAFQLRYPEPPVIIHPACGAEIKGMGPQSVVFTWTPSPGAPVWTRYILKITEVIDGNMQAGEALLTATTPSFFEKEVVGTSFFYGPDQPLFDYGKRYAFEVIAVDEETNTPFKNKGHSEPCYFDYLKNELTYGVGGNDFLEVDPIDQGMVKPGSLQSTPKPGGNKPGKLKKTSPDMQLTTPGLNFGITRVHGKLYYQFAGPVPEGAETSSGTVSTVNMYYEQSGEVSSGNSSQETGVGVTVLSNQQSFQLAESEPMPFIPGIYESETRDVNHSWPLGNVPVRIVVQYKIWDRQNNQHIMLSKTEVENLKLPDDLIKLTPDAVLASGYTTPDGNFDLIFSLHDSLGPVLTNQDFVLGHYETGKKYNGDLYCVLRLMVDNPYYCSPSRDIVVQPLESREYPDLFALQRTYGVTLRLNVEKSNYTITDDLEGLEVYILRDQRPNGVSSLEGIPNDTDYDGIGKEMIEGMEVVAMDYVNGNNEATFHWLVSNLGPNDKYYAIVKSDRNELLYFESGLVPFKDISGNTGSGLFNASSAGTAVFNKEYQYDDSHVKNITVWPMYPQLSGRVRDASSLKKLQGAEVDLQVWALLFPVTEASTVTDEDGRYMFSDIKDIVTWVNGNTYDIVRLVKAKHPGYASKYEDVNGGAGLKYGQKLTINDILLEPEAVIKGVVVDDETGYGIASEVYIIDGASTHAKPMMQAGLLVAKCLNTGKILGEQLEDVPAQQLAGGGQGGEGISLSVTNPVMAYQASPAYFEMNVPSGNHFLVVKDDLNNYFIDTFNIKVNKGENLFNIHLNKKIHRLKVTVRQATAGESASGQGAGVKLALTEGNDQESNSTNVGNMVVNVNQTTYSGLTGPIPNAKVRIKGRTGSYLTDNAGNVYLEFGGSDNFQVEVRSPGDANYEDKTVYMANFRESKKFKPETIPLRRSAEIYGQVFAGNSPVEGAIIRVALPGKNLAGVTDADGNYRIRGIPTGKMLKIQAMKSQSQYIGDEKFIVPTLADPGPLDFKLLVYEDMDITKILDFPMGVTSLKEENGKVIINGEMNNIPVNGQVDPVNQFSCLPFQNLEIVPGTQRNDQGIPYAFPAGDQITSTVNQYEVKINKSLSGNIIDTDHGIRILPDRSSSGLIQGQLKVNTDDSFLNEDADLGDDGIYACRINDNKVTLNLPLIRSNAVHAFPDEGIPVCNSNKGDIEYKLYGFSARAGVAKSHMKGNKLLLNTKISLQISNLDNYPMSIDLGDVAIGKYSISYNGTSAPLTIPIEKWSLRADQWSLGQSGLILNSGKVQTHYASVNFFNMKVDPVTQALKNGTFDLNMLGLKDLTHVQVTGESSFFYDAGHWTLAVYPKAGNQFCGYIPTLPGMDQGKNMDIQSIFLQSDLTGNFNISKERLRLYQLVKFMPVNLVVSDDYLDIAGVLDLSIPEVDYRSVIVQYRKDGGNLAFRFRSFQFDFATNGVHLSFPVPDNALSANGFHTNGSLYETGKYSVGVKLDHTPQSTMISALPNQDFKIDQNGNSYLDDIVGNMKVENKAWTNFIFSGDLVGCESIQGNLTFEVKGEVTASGESVKMDKMNTPFGDMDLEFDFYNRRLTGTLSVSQELNGAGRVAGNAEAVFDGSGWYFCGGGTIEMYNNPYIKQASTAMLFGSYPNLNDPYIMDIFKQYTYTKKLPASLNTGIRGFYTECISEFPIPYIPDIDVDLGVLTGQLGVSVGGGFRTGINFSDNGTIFYTGTSTFVNAHIGVGGSIGVACAGTTFSADFDLNQFGELNTNGSWYVEGKSTLSMHGRAYIGGGCCNADCDYLGIPCPSPCVEDSWNGTKSVTFNLHMGSDKSYINVDL